MVSGQDHHITASDIFADWDFVISGKLTCKYGFYGYYLYKGVPFTELIHYPEKMTECEKYDQFRDDDVYILTYPKSGQSIMSKMLSPWHQEIENIDANLETVKVSAFL